MADEYSGSICGFTAIDEWVYGMQAAKKEFESKVLVWKSNLDTLQREIEQQIGAYEKKQKQSINRRKKTDARLDQIQTAAAYELHDLKPQVEV